MTDIVFRPRKEVNKISKKGKPRDVKAGILLPIPYRAAVSSLVLHMLYELLNSLEDVVAYRFVYDVDEDAVESLDIDTNLRNLDVLLISASFELDYINIAKILLHLKLLPKQKGKTKPLVVVGGLAPTANPLPLCEIADAVVIGEAEEVIEEIVYAAKDQNPSKILEDLKCLALPPFDHKVKRCYVEDLDSAYHPVKQVYSVEEEPVFGHGIRVELSRGCPYLCAFCMEAHILYPFRYRSYARVWNIIERGLEFSKIVRRAVFYSLSFYSIPYSDILIDKLVSEGISASIPSLRLEHIDRRRLEAMYQLGQKTVTLAPETLVEKYGYNIGKCVDVDKLANTVIDAYDIGYEHVKLYLITGFPHIDIEEEVKSLKNLLEKLKTIKKHRFVEISLNILIPKPWTPYQYLPPSHVLENSSRIRAYRSVVKDYSVATLSTMDPRWGYIQAIISQGNRRVSDIIIECTARGCTIRTFLELVERDEKTRNSVYSGWGENVPWAEVVDMGFNTKYLVNRFTYLMELKKRRPMYS